MNQKHTGFLGTYFDPEKVLRLVRWIDIAAWVVAVVYGLDLVVALGVFVLQIMRGFMGGMGFTDYIQNVLYIIERPFRGIVYFVVLQAVSKALLILMDMEDNTRRAARNASN
jgi:hypothetical protein